MNQKKKLSLFFWIHILILIILEVVVFVQEDFIKNSLKIMDPSIKLWQMFLGFLLLIFGIYFFVLPGKFIVGGLESELIFLDKLFFYDKKKKIQKEILSNSNFIIFLRFLIILMVGFTEGPLFVVLTMLVNSLFIIIFKLLNYCQIPKDFFIKYFPSSIQKKNIYKFLSSSLIIGLTVGLGCRLIFENHGNTGGSDVIFKYISSIIHIAEFSTILMFIDGIMILWSCYLELCRHSKKYKHQIILRYLFSSIAFFNVILFIKW